MKTASFSNWTDEEFIGYWDGKPKTFPSGGSPVFMPDYLAKHFAKHLTNRELIKTGHETEVSPKKPEQHAKYMELFTMAYQPEEIEELGDENDDIDSLIGAANKNKEQKEEIPKESTAEKDQNLSEPQYVIPPDDDEDDSEESFDEKPVEPKKSKRGRPKKNK